MEPVRPVTLPLSVDAPIRPVAPVANLSEVGRQVLDSAVSVELSPDAAATARSEADQRGFERDSETQSLVYRVTDAQSGEVVIQIPDEIVLKARAYAREANPPTGERIERRA